jgi:hypothetical protein
LLVAALAAAAAGEDIFPADYRGQEGYAAQEWDFITSGDTGYGGYSAPDGVGGITDNPYGPVMANATGGTYLEDQGPGPGGAWQGGSLMFFVPNRLEPDPDSWKWLRVQVTASGPGFSVNAGSTGGEQWSRLDEQSADLGSGWQAYAIDWLCEPNPDAESVTIALDAGTAVSEVIIDTVCIPEPVTLMLTAAGAASVLRRRRKS